MAAVEELITENIDIWTSAVKRKSSAGRGGGKKIELYGVKKLRELILDLAVRGLLVPQEPNDEPASVLLERIAAEKAELVKAGKLKKTKIRSIPTNDDQLPSLPRNWAHIGFGELYELEYGNNLPKAVRTETGEFPVFGSNGIVGSHNEQSIDRPCIVVGRKGSAGALNLCEHIGCWVTDVAYSIVPSTNLSLRYTFLSMHTYGLDTLGKGIKPGLNRNEAYNLIVAVPPLPEQHRIVAKVDELMALCDLLEQQTESSLTAHKTLVQTLLGALTQAAATLPKNDRQTATDAPTPFTQAWNRLAEHFDTVFTTEDSIEQLKQTILQLAVMGKLVPQDPNDEPASELLKRIAAEKAELVKAKKIKKQKALPEIGEEEKPFALPIGWEWSRLPDIGELARGKSKHRPRNAPILYANGNIPLVQTGDVSQSNGVIKTYTALYNETGLAQSRLWLKGTMCITIAANIADTGVLTFDACFPDSVVGFIPFDNQIKVKFFEYFIRTAKNDLEKYAPSTAQKNINLEILGNLLVPLPPLNELNQIVAKVEELMSACDQIKARLTDAQNTQLQLADTVTEHAIRTSHEYKVLA